MYQVAQSVNSARVSRFSEAKLPTEYGDFKSLVYRGADAVEHMVLTMGRVKDGALCRVHSECMTGEVFGSTRCDCRSQLQEALRKIAAEGMGILIYLRQEGRGIGLGNKIRAYALQDEGADTVEANKLLGLPIDGRNYEVAAQILQDLEISSVRLLTNNPRKIHGLNIFGIQAEAIPHQPACSELAQKYLATKKERLGHKL